MNNISIDISGRIDPDRISVLRSINEVADSLGIHFFVVGAFARDVVFEHMHRIPAPRRTMDLDIGVDVSDWKEFDRLIDALVERGLLERTRSPHRFRGGGSVVVDIVPYGGVTDVAKKIAWPSDLDTVMNVFGFEEAYRFALKVRVADDTDLDIMVPSIPAIVLMKIISWDDSYPRRERDAQDLLFILENYVKTVNDDELYGIHAGLLEEEGYDNQLASVRLLGKEVAHMLDQEGVSAVTAILSRETDEEKGFRMLRQMIKGDSYQGIKFQTALQLLKKVMQGIQEGRHT